MWKRCVVALVLLLISASGILSVHAQNTKVFITVQQFEKGLMIWRGDNSTIYVLGNQGRVLVFPSSAYSTLTDNPIFGDPPSRLRPIMGFGRVWGHHTAVRDLIGWPVLDEMGFETSLITQNRTVFITELDGSVIQINPTRTWQRNPAGGVTPPPAATGCPYPLFFGRSDEGICAGQSALIQAAYQPFEHGFMIWLANTGDIWVYYHVNSRWQHFAQAHYEGFADAAPEQAPANMIQPVNGFGRVWHNLAGMNGQSIRSELGGAIARETGYRTMTQFWGRTSHTHVYMTIPDGRIIDAYSGLAGIVWSWVQ